MLVQVVTVVIYLTHQSQVQKELRIDLVLDMVHLVIQVLQVLMAKLLKLVLLSIAVLFALSTMGVDLTALAVFGGAVGVGIGFGLQRIFANLISGVILLLDRSIKPGDVIAIGGSEIRKLNQLVRSELPTFWHNLHDTIATTTCIKNNYS